MDQQNSADKKEDAIHVGVLETVGYNFVVETPILYFHLYMLVRGHVLICAVHILNSKKFK